MSAVFLVENVAKYWKQLYGESGFLRLSLGKGRRSTPGNNGNGAPAFGYALQRLLIALYPKNLKTQLDVGASRRLQEWIRRECPGCTRRKNFIKALLEMEPELHSSVVDAFSEDVSVEWISERLRKQLQNSKSEGGGDGGGNGGGGGGRRRCIRRNVFDAHLQALFRILPSSISSSFPSNWREAANGLDFFTALRYCAGSVKLGEVRMELLFLCGYKRKRRLLQEAVQERKMSALERFPKVWKLVQGANRWGSKSAGPTHYLQLLDALNVISHKGISELKADTIVTRLNLAAAEKGRIRNRHVVFTILCSELRSLVGGVRAEKKIAALEQGLPFAFTKISKLEKLRRISKWHRSLVETVVRRMDERSKTSYREQRRGEYQHGVATYLEFLERDCAQRKNESLKEFIIRFTNLEVDLKNRKKKKKRKGNNSGAQEAREEIAGILCRFVESRRTDSGKVKSSLRFHYAQPHVQNFVHFLRQGLDLVVLLRNFESREVVSRLPNRRTPADPLRRRAFSDEEVERMLKVVAESPRDKLIILLLREIGLRISSLCHLRVGDLYDIRMKQPKRICMVREKRQTMRQFVASERLQEAVQKYLLFCEEEEEGGNGREKRNEEECYLFSSENSPIPRSTVNGMLKRVALHANVEAKMHAHAFRHTIVGKLLHVGNPISVVSRFLGHKNTVTTERHYYTSTAVELEAVMNNPFTGKKRKPESDIMKKEGRKKIRTLLDIVDTYNDVLAKGIKNNIQGATQIRNQIKERLPKLVQTLTAIEEEE